MAERNGSPPRDGRDPVMQRVRVGVTGLAAVFLLTLLAASILTLITPAPHAPDSAASGNAASNTADLPKEPLAELGVAPGGSTPKTASGSAAPASSAPPARKPAH